MGNTTSGNLHYHKDKQGKAVECAMDHGTRRRRGSRRGHTYKRKGRAHTKKANTRRRKSGGIGVTVPP